MNTETTTAPHTHRFNEDAECSRCGIAYSEVQAQRALAQAEVATPAQRIKADMVATAKINDKKDRAASRRSYYERTGR